LRSSSAGNDTVIFGWIVGFGALVVVIIIMIYIFFR
jgi:uncharacterized membrane protein (DUF485 family)